MENKLINHLNFDQDNYKKYLYSLDESQLKELDHLENCLFYQVYFDYHFFKNKLFEIYNNSFQTSLDKIRDELKEDVKDLKERIFNYHKFDESFDNHDYPSVATIVERDENNYFKENYIDLLYLKFFDNYNFINSDRLIKLNTSLVDIMEVAIKLIEEFNPMEGVKKHTDYEYKLIGFDKQLYVRENEGVSHFTFDLCNYIYNNIISIESNVLIL